MCVRTDAARPYGREVYDKIQSHTQDWVGDAARCSPALFLQRGSGVLTDAEQTERSELKDEIVSKVNLPGQKIYKGCVIRGSDPAKVGRLRELNIKDIQTGRQQHLPSANR